MLNPKVDIPIIILPALRVYCRWAGRKIIGSREITGSREMSKRYIRAGIYMNSQWCDSKHKTCIKEWGGRYYVPTLVKKLLAIDSCW